MNFIAHLTRREKVIFYLCIMVITAAIFYSLTVERVIKTWGELNLKIAKAEKELYKNYRLIRKEKNISSQYERYISYLKGHEGDNEAPSSILMEIETLARRNNVMATDIKPLEAKAVDFYKKYIFEVNVEADIKSLTKFIYDMQSSSKILTAEHLSLTAKRGGTDILHAEMRIVHVSVP